LATEVADNHGSQDLPGVTYVDSFVTFGIERLTGVKVQLQVDKGGGQAPSFLIRPHRAADCQGIATFVADQGWLKKDCAACDLHHID
jgi:hypothetical protein